MPLVLHAGTRAVTLTSYDGFEMGGLQLFGLDGVIESRTVVTCKASKSAQNLSLVFKIQPDTKVTK